MSDYPKYLYHKDNDGPILVKDEADQAAVGPEWQETPFDGSEPAKAKRGRPAKVADPAEPAKVSE